MNGYAIQQNTANQPLIFLVISSADHISGATGKTLTVTISKDGGSFAAPAGAVTEIGNGWYQVAANGTDSSTLGPLALHATGTGCDPTDWLYNVVAYNPQSGTNLGLSALPTANPAASGGLPTVDASNGVKLSVGTGTGQVNASGGKVPATMGSTDYAGNTVQTGDAYARIGATGSGLTSLAPAATALSTATWTATRAGYLDNLNVGGAVASHADTSSLSTQLGTPMQAGNVTVGGYAAGQDPATLVLDATASAHNTTGTIGHDINAAGTASDPWTTALPGSYTAGQAGYIIGHNLDAAVSTRSTFAGGAVASVTGSVGSISGVSFPANFAGLSIDSGGNVKIQGAVKKNQALAGFEFLMVLSSDHYTPAAGKTITATRSIDGAAASACANAATEVGNGLYAIDLAATDLNGSVITLEFAASGCDTTYITIVTQP